MLGDLPSRLRPYLHMKNRQRAATTKRTVKYLSVCSNPQAYRAVVRAAPDNVIRAIANAAYNVERGDIHLTPAQKTLFAKHRRAIAKLTSRSVSIKDKRKVVESQKGGFPFLPLIIGSALAAFGSRLFGGSQQQQQQQ